MISITIMNAKISNYQKTFAKLFDYAFCYLALAFATLLTPFADDELLYFYLIVATPLVWILPQSILLATWGSTPGCAIFGVAPSKNGAKLSWKDALKTILSFGRNSGIDWVICTKKLPNFITRLIIGCTIIAAAVFGKAIIQFPQTFEKQVSIKGKGWVRFTSSENDFTANFPSKPMVEQKQLEIPQVKRTLDYQEVKTDHTDQVTYSVSALELPTKWRIFSSSTILKGALSVVLDSNMPFGTKLISRDLTKHGEHPAINFHMRDGDTDIKGRLILVGGKLFKVEYIQAKAATQEEDAGLAFINSFKPITDPLVK